MSEWQDIETAPKDGAVILIAPHMTTACWELGDEGRVVKLILEGAFSH